MPISRLSARKQVLPEHLDLADQPVVSGQLGGSVEEPGLAYLEGSGPHWTHSTTPADQHAEHES